METYIRHTIAGLLLSAVIAATASALPLQQVHLPQGFSISIYTNQVPGARSMALAPDGTLFVGTRSEGKVYAVIDADHNGRAERVVTIAKGLNSPNGVAFKGGALYVAEISRILRFNDIEKHLTHPGRPVVVNDRLPHDAHHGWKFIRFGPDGRLYVPVGAPCNICDPGDPYAAILRMCPDGSNMEIFAKGIRNSVGFDWDPRTKELWFTDNGRDWLGANRPPDELNHAPHAGMDFGYPYWHGKNIPDPEFGGRIPKSAFTPPAIELGPHVAALGVRFYTGTTFPEKYHHRIFIAEHGSWNRIVPVGYRITMVRLQGNRAVSYKVFAAGWLQHGHAWGRPVDLQVMPDGTLLISDDHAGVIYRIVYSKARAADSGSDASRTAPITATP